jgi:hypothetical protein
MCGIDGAANPEETRDRPDATTDLGEQAHRVKWPVHVAEPLDVGDVATVTVELIDCAARRSAEPTSRVAPELAGHHDRGQN